MPRKALKTASEAQTQPSQGVDSQKPTEAPKTPKKIGRPSKYTPELAAEICERLSNGEPLRQICRDDHMPAWTAVYDWMARDEALSQRIAHAREQGFEAIAEEALVIADTPLLGQKQILSDDKSSTVVEDMLGHRKLQIETRLKLLAKWNPKKYGDRMQLAGDAENPLQVNVSTEVFDTILQNIESTRQTAKK